MMVKINLHLRNQYKSIFVLEAVLLFCIISNVNLGAITMSLPKNINCFDYLFMILRFILGNVEA